jgi:hypothetical protein
MQTQVEFTALGKAISNGFFLVVAEDSAIQSGKKPGDMLLMRARGSRVIYSDAA